MVYLTSQNYSQLKQKFKTPEDFKVIDSNNINATKGHNDSAGNSSVFRNSNNKNNADRNGSGLWGKARAKLGISKPSRYERIVHIIALT